MCYLGIKCFQASQLRVSASNIEASLRGNRSVSFASSREEARSLWQASMATVGANGHWPTSSAEGRFPQLPPVSRLSATSNEAAAAAPDE